MANLDPALDEAADNLGSGPWRRLFRVTLPLVRPGIFAGATIVFIWSFTELGTPLIFEFYKTTPVQIFERISQLDTSGQPYALTLIMLAFALGFYLIGKVAFGREAHAMYSKASRAASERPLSRPAGAIISGAFAIVTLAAAMPHVGVIFTGFAVPGSWYRSLLPSHMTLDHYATALSDQVSSGAIFNSFVYSLFAVVVCILLGLLAAYTLVRLRPRGRSVLDTLTMLPLAVPGLVLAFGYVALTLRWPFAGGSCPRSRASRPRSRARRPGSATRSRPGART